MKEKQFLKQLFQLINLLESYLKKNLKKLKTIINGHTIDNYLFENEELKSDYIVYDCLKYQLMDLCYKGYIVSYVLDIHDIDLENYNMKTFLYLDEMTTFISKINKFIDNKKALTCYVQDTLEFIIKHQYSKIAFPEELMFSHLIDVEVKNVDKFNQALIYALKEEIKYYLFI